MELEILQISTNALLVSIWQGISKMDGVPITLIMKEVQHGAK